MKTKNDLFEALTTPSARLLSDMEKIDGDILILGAGGKIGPALCVLAKKASIMAGSTRRIIAASVFTSKRTISYLEENGVEVIETDLLDSDQLSKLPDAPNIIYMAGRKFGTQGDQSKTWAINTFLSATVAQRFPDSNIVAFSTGNVYGMRPIYSGGALENEALEPIGEYAQSCVGRERLLDHFSGKNSTPMLFFRLNYAIDLRYGVLYDIANLVFSQKPVDLSVGYINCIWQGDAAEIAIRSLLHCSTPPNILNVTGPESISVEYIAKKFASLFDVSVTFIGESPGSSMFSNAGKMAQLFGYPNVSLNQMIEWTAQWIEVGGDVIEAPTHFEQRSGDF